MAKVHKAYNNCSKKAWDFSWGFFFFPFKVIVRVVKSTFSVLLLKTFTSFPKDTSTEQWFWLDFFFFFFYYFWLRKTHNLPDVNLCFSLLEITTSNHTLCHTSKHEIPLQDRYSNLVCGNRLQRGKKFFALLNSLLLFTFGSATLSTTWIKVIN